MDFSTRKLKNPYLQQSNNLSPSIMEPCIMQDPVYHQIGRQTPDLLAETEMESLVITTDEYNGTSKIVKSFLLMDSNENLCIPTPELFCKKLQCHEENRLKVVSIFGNTGDGKSHTLNQFFNGEDVFQTSCEQNSCTIGVWCAYHEALNVLFLDTEGLLGLTKKENQRTRLLLKVLAISDIIIYRTRAERLHRDLFSFLGTASVAFCKHFAYALESLGDPQALGPAVIIFHETQNTKPLEPTLAHSVEDYLRKEFSEASMDLKAFSSLKYIGVQTTKPPTDFRQLKNIIEVELEKTDVRTPRSANVIFQALKVLNLKFSGEIKDRPGQHLIPEQYFTCQAICNSCNERCENSMCHVQEGVPHKNSKPCRYQHQFENKELLCMKCYQEGRRIVVKVTAKTNNESAWMGYAQKAWRGSIIECPTCGEIFREFKYWYGNKTPEEEAVRTQIVHVWNTGPQLNGNSSYSAQMLLDGVSYLSEVVASVSKQPTKSISMWVADKVAPSYWKLNSQIVHCNGCENHFERKGLKIHHCRSCGEGFCNACSKNKMPVPSRGWDDPVRVCDTCKNKLTKSAANNENNSPQGSNQFDGEAANVRVRKYGEVVLSTISSVASVLEYPKDLIKDSARPSYWVPDAEAANCALCKIKFTISPEELATNFCKSGDKVSHSMDNNTKLDCHRHHCRACGQVFCNLCSIKRRPVPERGWTSDVRVCNGCFETDSK